MDVKMPRMNGIEAFRSIKVINSAIPVIMMTGYSVDQLLKEAFELGAYGCLYKPFEMEEVLAVVEKTLKPQQA
jgi:CheY-like chemotaxis protein